MWELIRANKRNSILLMMVLAAVLLALGAVIGGAFVGGERGLFGGIMIATALWFILTIISFAGGDQIFLATSRAKLVNHDVHPQLFNIVEEMSIASGLPMPKVYIINDPAPNAFATGRNPKNASVAVTAGLLAKLNRDELQGVIAHEMSHILHRDILFITMAGIMLGSIVMLSQVFLRGMFYSSLGGSSRRYSSGSGKGQGQAQIIMLVLAILAAILAPIMAHLLYFAISRKREYLADAGAARLTRYPEGLARALEKIAGDPSPQLATANKVTAALFIANPLKKKGSAKLSNLSSTHPPLAERIKILRNLTHGASFKDYSDSYSQLTGKDSPVPASALTKEQVEIRDASARTKKKQRTDQQLRQIGDIMRQVNGFLFLTCVCGLKFKIPPNYKKQNVKCPKCGKTNNLSKR
jgi:heat shock protein HtpX